jgi:glycylpeptide N-tetradecanoyltransferase
MELKDVPQVHKLLNSYLSQFHVAAQFSEDEIRHWMLPLDTVVYSFVVESEENPGEITDFYSFYSLPSSVIGNPKHSHINAAYLFYYVPMGMGQDLKRLQVMMKDALIMAKQVCYFFFAC